MWHVSSRSDVATLQTAIHLLLTYLLTYSLVLWCGLQLHVWRGLCVQLAWVTNTRTTWRPAGTELPNYWLVTHSTVRPSTRGPLAASTPSWWQVSHCGQAGRTSTSSTSSEKHSVCTPHFSQSIGQMYCASCWDFDLPGRVILFSFHSMTGTVHWLSLHFVAGSSNKLQPNASGLNFSELTYAVQKTTLLHYITLRLLLCPPP